MLTNVRRNARAVLVAVLVTVMCFSSISVLTVSATQSRSENFNKSYVLKDNGAADMVAIATAQLGKTGSALGYTEEWCANFVGDCAKLANQEKAIPKHGGVTGLYDNIMNNGGIVSTDNPLPGDICFINWDGGTSKGHVEIVYDVSDGKVSTIGGNSGDGSSLSTRSVKQHAPLSKKYIVCIVRPDYKSTKKPLDIAFVIDTSGSMGDDIAVVKQNMLDYIEKFDDSEYDYRMAIVDYRDFPERTGDSYDYAYKVQTDFISDRTGISNSINSLDLGYGGDDNETLYSALIKGLGSLSWRKDASKVSIVMGDAPALDPEPYTGYTLSYVIDFLGGDINLIDGYDDDVDTPSRDGAPMEDEDEVFIDGFVQVFTIATSDNEQTIDSFGKLSTATKGKAYTAFESVDVDSVIEDIIKVMPEVIVEPIEEEKDILDYIISFIKLIIGKFIALFNMVFGNDIAAEETTA